MAERTKVYIFHIYRRDGSSLFLHPLHPPEKIVEMLAGSPIEGRYGREPKVEALASFRNELYRQIENGVKRWLADVRFIPKFLIAAALFVVTYFFFSYVVRDPLPVIDEVVLGVAAGIGYFILQGRRDLASKQAVKKRLDLRQIVDRVAFRESDFVKQVEEALHGIETEGAEELARRIVEPVRQELGEPYREEASQLIRLLESRLDLHRLAREERAWRKQVEQAKPSTSASPATRRDFVRRLQSKKYDFPLYAVYKSFKKTMAGIK
jgi:hypothetical protein